MAKLKIIWTETALQLKRNILTFWIEKNKSTVFARKLNNLIFKRVKLIADTKVQFQKIQNSDIYVSNLGEYSILYRMDEKNLYILAIWNQKQNPDDLIEILNL